MSTTSFPWEAEFKLNPNSAKFLYLICGSVESAVATLDLKSLWKTVQPKSPPMDFELSGWYIEDFMYYYCFQADGHKFSVQLETKPSFTHQAYLENPELFWLQISKKVQEALTELAIARSLLRRMPIHR